MLKYILIATKKHYKLWSYKVKLHNYYQGKGQVSHSLVGKILNFLLIRIAIFVLSWLWFAKRLKEPISALILSSIITVLISLAIYLWKRRRFIEKRVAVRHKVATEFLIDRLKQLSLEEFKWHIMRLLLKLPTIGPIRSHLDYLESTFNGKKIAIGYCNDRFSEEVSPRRLEAFIHKVELDGYQEAMYITSGKYNEQCRNLAKKKKLIKIYLLDEANLVDIMEKSNLYPENHIIDKLIYKEISKQSGQLKMLKKEILAPKRIRTYLSYSIFFIAASGVFKAFSLYYMILSSAFLVLALITYFSNAGGAQPTDEAELFIDELTVGHPADKN